MATHDQILPDLDIHVSIHVLLINICYWMYPQRKGKWLFCFLEKKNKHPYKCPHAHPAPMSFLKIELGSGLEIDEVTTCVSLSTRMSRPTERIFCFMRNTYVKLVVRTLMDWGYNHPPNHPSSDLFSWWIIFGYWKTRKTHETREI
jgi:hypothetical protein